MNLKKSKEKSHKLNSIIAIISVLMVLMISGIWAFLKDREDVSNIFTIGEVDIELVEKVSGTAGGNDEVLWDTVLSSVTGEDANGDTITVDAFENIEPEQVIAKQPYIRNTGKNNAYVYVKVSVPIVNINGEDTELFSFTSNSGWTLNLSSNEEVNNIKYKVYKYQYDVALAPGGVTTTLFDNVTVTDKKWKTADFANMAEIQQIDIDAYAIQTEGVTLAQGYDKFFPYSVGDITVANYGQYVNLNTHILDLNNISLGENNENPLSDWRVFNKDNNGAWLILADYMPNASFDVTTVGLLAGTSGYAKYGVRSTTNRATLLSGLTHNNWSSLITESSVAGATGVQVKGAVDLDTWVDSWNANEGYTTLYTDTYYNKNSSYMSDGLDGYYVGNFENPTIDRYSLYSDVGYGNTLYFPHKSNVSSCSSYWLASPSVFGSDPWYVMNVYYNSGQLTSSRYSEYGTGVRPAVYLPSNIRLNTEGTVWTIAD